MILTILGCGTSTGVPLIGCKCKVCRSRNPRNKRLRTSAWLQARGKSILIDPSIDLRQQALRHEISKLDAVLVTHPHSDHVGGLDELRSYNFHQKAAIPVLGNAWSVDELRQRFPYIFRPGPALGGGIPRIDLRQIDSGSDSIDVAGIPVTPISLQHGKKECVGYRIESIAYVTDCSYIPPSSVDRLRGVTTLVLDCVRLAPHETHLNLDGALEVARAVGAKTTVLTHLGHDFDYAAWKRKLPRGVVMAYDGMKIGRDKR